MLRRWQRWLQRCSSHHQQSLQQQPWRLHMLLRCCRCCASGAQHSTQQKELQQVLGAVPTWRAWRQLNQ
jgi:hypothetical protein